MTNEAKAQRYGRSFVDANLQVTWTTVTLAIDSQVWAGAGSSSYPIIYPDGTSFIFQSDVVIFGVDFSVTMFSAAAAEKAVIAISEIGSQKSVLGPSGIWKQTMFANQATTAANTAVWRTPGFVFPTPFVKYVATGTAAQLYGTRNVNMSYSALATIYFCSTPDFKKLMAQAFS